MSALALDRYALRKGSSSPLAQAMRAQSEVAGPTGARVDRACLDAGLGLGAAIPGLTDLVAVFETLSGALQSEAFCAATDDLGAIAAELARAAQDLVAEGQALGELVQQNESIGKKIEDLVVVSRTMSSLVFTLKIEAAPLTRTSADMGAFAQHIHELAETTRRALVEYRATHGRLDALLRAAHNAHARFRAEYQAKLALVASEIRDNLEQAAARRRDAVTGLKETGEQTREIGARIGDCVVALQIGDSTRQRIEHATGALALMADALDGRAGQELFGVSPADLEASAARACRLQARQIEAAREELSREIATTLASLGELVGRSLTLSAHGQDLFGPADSQEGSFVARIEDKLSGAREIAAHCGHAREAVDEAAASIVAIVGQMRSGAASLLELVLDVTIIGTNALLRSARLGEQGKGVAIIARELRAYGEQTGAIIRTLPAALDGLVDLAARFSHGERLDAASLAQLQARMSSAVDIFGATSRDMTAALARLAQNAQATCERLSHATATLESEAGVDDVLAGVVEGLEEAARLGDGGAASRPDLDTLLDRLLRPHYTMEGERRVHEAFLGRRAVREDVRARPPASRDLADAFLL